MTESTSPAPFAGLELLATAVVLLDEGFCVRQANPAAEALLDAAARSLLGQRLPALFAEEEVFLGTLSEALRSHWSYTAQNVSLVRTGREPLPVVCTATRIDAGPMRLLIEMRPIEQQLRQVREESLVAAQDAYRDLLRNLAHEIRNPLGGLRGSAQLLDRELDQPELREYTQVIIKEADRLRALVDRLLAPHRAQVIGPINMHEILERVRSLVLAEFPRDIAIQRDYDPSIPEFPGDKEQLIQAVLNVVRNAAQALAAVRDAGGREGTITLRTRVARQATFLRQRHRLALELLVLDDGPGVPEAIRDRIFSPLVSGREGGSGLGLSLAQTYVQYHQGVIACDSRPGRTVFSIVLPVA